MTSDSDERAAAKRVLVESLKAEFEKVHDRSASPADRLASIWNLLGHETVFEAKVSLLEIANDPTESDEMLRLAGGLLLKLFVAGVVDQFDLRDLTDTADEAFMSSEW